MSDEAQLISNISKARAINRDDLPKLGEWYWVKVDVDHGKRKVKMVEEEWLMCAAHIASNHTQFYQHEEDGEHIVHVMHWDVMEKVRPAMEWRAHWQEKSDALQLELKEAVKALATTCMNANLIDDPSIAQVETLLPSTTRVDPEHYKKALTLLKEKTYPVMQGNVKSLMRQMVGVQKNMFLAQRSQATALDNVVKKIDDRLFALELYAGFHDKFKLIADGEPAPQETPITIRQMLRYMDEETLIAATDGGMDFGHLEDFDEWVAGNIKTICPEPRCVVAFQIRRNMKDYGPCKDIGTAFQHYEWHKEDMKTYLLIRNGDKAYRYATTLEFSPRLLPLREEFNKPFYKDHYWSDEEKKPITPQDIAYDECAEARTKVMMHYNRITFLLQGLLDRSEVFNPHPPIALNDPEVIAKWVKFNYDEEDGLPTFNPPNWDVYRDKLNSRLHKGMVVYAKFDREKYDSRSGRYWSDWHIGFYKITKISRDLKTLTINEAWGTRWGYEHRNSWGNGYHGKFGEWPVNKRRQYKVGMKCVFNVKAYTPGDYKKFLCDAYLKGAYLQWAPYLLMAEKWHKLTPEQREAEVK